MWQRANFRFYPISWNLCVCVCVFGWIVFSCCRCVLVVVIGKRVWNSLFKKIYLAACWISSTEHNTNCQIVLIVAHLFSGLFLIKFYFFSYTQRTLNAMCVCFFISLNFIGMMNTIIVFFMRHLFLNSACELVQLYVFFACYLFVSINRCRGWMLWIFA